MKVSGILKEGEIPVSDANVILLRDGKITNLGTITDEKGYFELENKEINPDDTFRISYVGYETKYFKADELKGDEIQIKESIEDLDEVIITNDIGDEPKEERTIERAKQQWYKSPAFIIGGISVVTIATIILIIKKTR